jgi:acyl-CoA synthetase (AMP-forming)/AMP-acid ligase II
LHGFRADVTVASDVVSRFRDDDLRPVADGEPGELVIGGAGLARGYWRRPDLTTERFLDSSTLPVESPARPASRFYRSGDLVRRSPDGLLDFVGRVDGQIELRGFRIEPGEVENVLNRVSGVRRAAVTTATTPSGEKHLVAYYACDGAVSRATLRAAARTALPKYMVPSLFVEVETLPVTANGKLDRRAVAARARPRVRSASVDRAHAPHAPVTRASAPVRDAGSGTP